MTTHLLKDLSREEVTYLFVSNKEKLNFIDMKLVCDNNINGMMLDSISKNGGVSLYDQMIREALQLDEAQYNNFVLFCKN